MRNTYDHKIRLDFYILLIFNIFFQAVVLYFITKNRQIYNMYSNFRWIIRKIMIKYNLKAIPNNLFLRGYCKIQLSFVAIEKYRFLELYH